VDVGGDEENVVAGHSAVGLAAGAGMITCNGVDAIAAMLLGILMFNIMLVYMIGVVRTEVQELLRKWKELMG
jgi:hypothetical protein